MPRPIRSGVNSVENILPAMIAEKIPIPMSRGIQNFLNGLSSDILACRKWALLDSNQRPLQCECNALTS